MNVQTRWLKELQLSFRSSREAATAAAIGNSTAKPPRSGLVQLPFLFALLQSGVIWPS
jgi:hypothetical protein